MTTVSLSLGNDAEIGDLEKSVTRFHQELNVCTRAHLHCFALVYIMVSPVNKESRLVRGAVKQIHLLQAVCVIVSLSL